MNFNPLPLSLLCQKERKPKTKQQQKPESTSFLAEVIVLQAPLHLRT